MTRELHELSEAEIQHDLLQAVIDDHKSQVIAILNERPEALLTVPTMDTIQSQFTWQQFIPESPFVMAFKRNQVEMIKVMLPYLQQLDYNQVMQQWEQAEEGLQLQKTTYNFDALINHIRAGGDDMQSALHTFRSTILPPSAITLNESYHIEKLLLAAYQAYINKITLFKSTAQRHIFCKNVIGFLQSLVIPEVAKVFCEGLYYVVEEKQPISTRATSLTLPNGCNFYRSDKNTAAGLGFTSFCNLGSSRPIAFNPIAHAYIISTTKNLWGAQQTQASNGTPDKAHTLLQKLFETKTSELAKLKERIQARHVEQSKPSCLIL